MEQPSLRGTHGHSMINLSLSHSLTPDWISTHQILTFILVFVGLKLIMQNWHISLSSNYDLDNFEALKVCLPCSDGYHFSIEISHGDLWYSLSCRHCHASSGSQVAPLYLVCQCHWIISALGKINVFYKVAPSSKKSWLHHLCVWVNFRIFNTDIHHLTIWGTQVGHSTSQVSGGWECPRMDKEFTTNQPNLMSIDLDHWPQKIMMKTNKTMGSFNPIVSNNRMSINLTISKL